MNKKLVVTRDITINPTSYGINSDQRNGFLVYSLLAGSCFTQFHPYARTFPNPTIIVTYTMTRPHVKSG